MTDTGPVPMDKPNEATTVLSTKQEFITVVVPFTLQITAKTTEFPTSQPSKVNDEVSDPNAATKPLSGATIS